MTRRQKHRRLAGWLAELFSFRTELSSQRRILVEPLERRQMLAGDAFDAFLGTPQNDWQDPTFGGSAGLVGEGEPVAEGEPAPDLVAFARALTDSGTLFFGASWCTYCTAQKELFEDGGKYLPFVEVTNPDRTPNQIAFDEDITTYPTWEFPDGSRLTGLQSLETLSQRSGVAIPQSETPSMADLPNVSVGIGSPLHVPIDAYDPNGNPLTISVSSSDSNLVTAEVLSGNRSWRLNVAGYGDMVFELFEHRAPAATGRIIELTTAQPPFYDGVTFHRVINNFVIQGGDPTGTGAGGSTLGDFDDQYNLELQHNRTGVLSYAKSTDDTNDSQFFITEGPQRFLDFNHMVFGQLVEGEAVRDAISNTATDGSDRPINAVTIETATVFDDTENGVIVLRPTGNGTGSATITVTVSDGQGQSTSQTFIANVIQDTANGAPFLNPIDPVSTEVNTPVSIHLSSQDKEGDTVIYQAQVVGSPNFGLTVDSATGQVTVTPPADFVGELTFRATVRQTTQATTSSQDDNQLVTVTVTQPETSAPTSVDLNAESDSGASDSDNITNANILVFTVAGTTTGALVEIHSGGNVVGSATATGSSTEVTVNDVAALGEGTLLFTATQSIGSQTSDESPSITILLDQTGPDELGSGIIPVSAIAEEALIVDIDADDEGNGLTYALTVAPSGMTLNATTGLLEWTPTISQVGSQALAIRMTDIAGNTTLQDFTIHVVDDPIVSVQLDTVDVDGLPLTEVAVGDTFRVQVTVQDLRGFLATGVFAAYLDLFYDPDVIEPVATNSVIHVSPYTNGAKGSTAAAGIINELGGFSSSTSPLDGAVRVLAEVTFTAKSVGNAGLFLDYPDDTGNDILVYSENSAVPFSRVDLGSMALTVGADFELRDDAFTVDEDAGQQSLDVLANDQVSSSSVLTIIGLGVPSAGGQVSIAADGKTVNYTPAANFHGFETFSYTASNQNDIQATAMVTVQVAEQNDPPIARDDSYSVAENSLDNVLDVRANDSTGVDDVSEDLTITAVSAGSAGGAISIGTGGGFLVYSPADDFIGTETFEYTLSDGRGGTDTATVSVAVGIDNPPPIARDDSFELTEDDAQASFDVLANDSPGITGETLMVTGVGTSTVGSTFLVAPDGQSVLYKPAANFSGPETLTYTIKDSGGGSATAIATFVVDPVNDGPQAVDDTATALAGEPTTIIDVLSNDVDVDGDSLIITAVTQPPSGEGTVAISSDGKTLIYTPPDSVFEGQFSFSYTIEDGHGGSDSAMVQMSVRDYIPRDFEGTVYYQTDDSSSVLSGVQLRLSGTDFVGASVEETTTVDSDGSYSFDSLRPGEYMLIRDALPFFNDSGQSIEFTSGATDGDATNDFLVTGTLKPKFFGIRDFFGSTIANSFTVAVDQDGTSAWYASRGQWNDLSSISVSVDEEDNLNVSAVDQNSKNVTGSLAIDDPTSGVEQVGAESSYRLLRIIGSPSAAGIVAGNSITVSGEGEGPGGPVQTATQLVAEGEDAAALPMAPTIASVRQSVRNTDSSSKVQTLQIEPTDMRRGLLASNSASTNSSGVMSKQAVDEAMKVVLPSLEVRLSEDLQDALTSNEVASLQVNDETIAGW